MQPTSKQGRSDRLFPRLRIEPYGNTRTTDVVHIVRTQHAAYHRRRFPLEFATKGAGMGAALSYYVTLSLILRNKRVNRPLYKLSNARSLEPGSTYFSTLDKNALERN